MGKKKRENWEIKEKSIFRELLEWVIYILIIVVLTYLVITYVGQRTQVIGESMMPTLEDGDNLIVDKITYRFNEPERYDIIVFPYQHDEETFYIKRIVGLPGETVQVIEGILYVNGEDIGENYGAEMMEFEGVAVEPIELGADEYFVLGDNRNNSSDSRDVSVGAIHRDDIIGKAWVRIWPLTHIEVIEHE